MEFTKTIALALLQLTAVCVCQKFGVVYRRPVVASGDKQIAARQQYATQSAADYAYQPQQLSALEQYYQQQQAGQQQQLPYYPQQQQKKLLEQQQQSRLQQQHLQLQQLQQLRLQQQMSQQPSSSAAAATAYYQPHQQQQQQQQQQQLQQEQQLYNDFYQQQLQQQQLQLQQQQQAYYQQKPLFKPAIPVTETPAEDRPLTASFPQASPQQADQQLPANLLGVLYSSAADVSKFQFSGNGVNYSY